ncbi:MAG: hypothetical protein EOP48_20125 [Sphingobacteriales bacterium]|nr:MAG: hypothetical protein EOP48_20125 [Sphingobacteriales bacterium]
MFETIVGWVVKISPKFLHFLFRWFYSSEKLTNMIGVTIGSENEGIVVNCSGLPEARAWVEITNLSPFELNLVGTEANLIWVGKVAEFTSMQRLSIKRHSKIQILLETSLTELQSKHIEETNHMERPRLYISLYFESSIRLINKVRSIETSNARLLNCKST